MRLLRELVVNFVNKFFLENTVKQLSQTTAGSKIGFKWLSFFFVFSQEGDSEQYQAVVKFVIASRGCFRAVSYYIKKFLAHI